MQSRLGRRSRRRRKRGSGDRWHSWPGASNSETWRSRETSPFTVWHLLPACVYTPATHVRTQVGQPICQSSLWPVSASVNGEHFWAFIFIIVLLFFFFYNAVIIIKPFHVFFKIFQYVWEPKAKWGWKIEVWHPIWPLLMQCVKGQILTLFAYLIS